LSDIMELKLKSEPLTWKAQDFIFKGEAQCFPSEGLQDIFH